jgi:hypothetical protein
MAGYFLRPGKKIRMRLFGKITTAVTPGNGSFDIYWGTGADANGTILASSAALALTASQTNLSWELEIAFAVSPKARRALRCRGIWSANVGVLASTLQPAMIPASASADVNVDLSPSANNIISVQFKRSGSTVETMAVQDLEVYGRTNVIRFYLVPVEAAPGFTGPKYFPYRGDPDPPALVQLGDDGLSIHKEARTYGGEPSMLLCANTTDADDATLAALVDVTKFADDLDTQLGPRLAAMQTALEALNLPAQMLTTATTDRLVIRGIMAIFSVAQCMQGKGFNIFSAGVTLSTQLSALPVAARQALQDCAAFLGYDETGITLASTVRQLLTKLVQQASPSPMLGVTV